MLLLNKHATLRVYIDDDMVKDYIACKENRCINKKLCENCSLAFDGRNTQECLIQCEELVYVLEKRIKEIQFNERKAQKDGEHL